MHSKLLPLASISLLFSLLAGCATTPDFDTTQVDKTLTPQSVIAEPDLSYGKIALWGGIILNTLNLENTTQIEILAYPLNTSYKPSQENQPLGRFIIQHKDYLEPATYAQGRLITVLGSISDNQNGKVGESTYIYPVINAQQIHLWSLYDDENRTSFHLGIGIRL